MDKGVFIVGFLLMLLVHGSAVSHQGTTDFFAAPVVTSTTHLPDTWVNNQKPVFKWEKLEGASKYRYAVDKNSGTIPLTGRETTSTSVQIGNAQDGESYFHVVACDDLRCGSTAGHYLIKVDTTPPPVVSNIVGTALQDGSIRLTWQEPSDATGIKEYRVYRRSVQKVGDRDFRPTDFGVTKLVTQKPGLIDSESLKEGASYYYRIAAVDGVGNAGAPSGIRRVNNVYTQTENAGTAPEPPTQEGAPEETASPKEKPSMAETGVTGRGDDGAGGQQPEAKQKEIGPAQQPVQQSTGKPTQGLEVLITIIVLLVVAVAAILLLPKMRKGTPGTTGFSTKGKATSTKIRARKP